MKISPCSSIPLNCFENALLINQHGTEFRIKGFSFDLQTSEILVDLKSGESLPFSRLSKWSVQLQNYKA